VTQSLTWPSDISLGKKGRIPWAKIENSRDDYIDPKFLPEGITLKQFHHLRVKDATSILEHWMNRRAKGKTPFRFKEMDKSARRERANSDGGGAGGQQEELPKKVQEAQAQGKNDDSSESINANKGCGDASGSSSSVSWLPKRVGGVC
jgi:hypothetical protein